MIKKNKIPVSIVIPTLGHSKIKHCLEKIQSSIYLPSEILIVVPKKNYNQLKLMSTLYKRLSIRVILSKKKHQVHQRILGFKKSKFKYVMQLDDDVKVDKYCLFNLFNFINGKQKIVVAPKYIDKIKLSKIYKKPNSILLKLYHWLINSNTGYAPGNISLSSFNYSDEGKEIGFKTHEWLSGGAIMHEKKNLILKNYYPYNFKRSYCEDVLHSLILRRNKIRLIKLYSAKVSAAQSRRINNEKSILLIIQNLFNEFLIRFYIVKNFNLSIFRLFVFYFIYTLRISLSSVKK